jgi:hypothetical protein
VASKIDEEVVDKVTFDNKDFKFVAAYTAYTSRFDEAEREERQHLNELITQLDRGRISYPDFYKEIDASDDQKRYRFHRVNIKGSRKFAYRKAQQEKNRIKRHKN